MFFTSTSLTGCTDNPKQHSLICATFPAPELLFWSAEAASLPRSLSPPPVLEDLQLMVETLSGASPWLPSLLPHYSSHCMIVTRREEEGRGEENEIPASVFVKEPVPYPRDVEEEQPLSPPVDVNRSQEEALQTINLSSDEELGPEDEDEEFKAGQEAGERLEKSRAEKIKRSSLKKVDSLKKAFSRQNIEKKMNKIGTKIVSQEKREKIKKSFTPNHQKSPTAKSSSFKVSPLTFNVKKVRDGEGSPQPGASPNSATATVELAPLSSPDEDLPFTEVHTQLSPGLEEAKAVADALEREEELPSPSSSGLEAELSITEDGNPEYALSATLPQEDTQLMLSSTLQQPEPAEEKEEGEEAEAAGVMEEGKESPTVEIALDQAS
ncbi:hypothetical protein JZ751_027828 [Albula glossodonta]|uniref:Uncharacterized protein n=1 Tax=Albula glossodonta TaxID=121402 RepID=A0A8T2PA16_9TELE|nr:hypothetical protein JZ751_027828 [Albula glossodonta]